MNAEGDQAADRDILPVLQSKEEQRAYYDKIASVYDLLAERSEQPMREKGLKLLDPRPGEQHLEIGFATGHTLVELARAVGPSGRVYGIDISPKMAELARKEIAKAEVADRVELTIGDAAQLPYPDTFFDGIFMAFTLELFPTEEIPKVLHECLRVLRPAGRLAVVSLSREGKPGWMVKAFEWTHRHFPNLLDCRPIYVRRALEESGFEIVDAQLEHMWVPVEIVLGKRPTENGSDSH